VEEYALVKPSQVLYTEPSQVAPYYPFLHPLIKEADNIMGILSKVGVKRSIGFSHIHCVLQMAKDKFQDNVISDNTKYIIQKAIRELIRLLQQHESNNKAEIVQGLKPLYLLSQENILMECSHLIVDNISGSIKLPLPTGYAYLHTLDDSTQQTAKQLVNLLPKEIGLINLRSILSYELQMVGTIAAKNVFPKVSVIKNILLSLEFKKGIELLSSCIGNGTVPVKVTDIMEQFQSNLDVQYLNDVRVTPILNFEGKSVIVQKTLSHWFFLQKGAKDEWILSLKNVQNSYPLHAFSNLAMQLCTKLQLKSTGHFEINDSSGLPDLVLFVSCMLQCDSMSKVVEVIQQNLPISFEPDETNIDNLDPSLGDLIPKSWHCKLDQNMLHPLDPEEWVGYETSSGEIVFAQVLHETICEHSVTDLGDSIVQRMLNRKFKVVISSDDHTTVEAHVLYLYKLLQNEALSTVDSKTMVHGVSASKNMIHNTVGISIL